MTKTQLMPVNGRKSFYGKAVVEDYGNGRKRLLSYDTPVCEIRDGAVTLTDKWDYSVTTITHVRAFLSVNGYPAGSKADIARRYKVA